MNPTETVLMSTPEALAAAQAARKAELEKRHRNGASWFYWVAALSVVNSFVLLMGGSWSFIIGLALTQLIDGVALAMSNNAGSLPVAAFMLDLLVAGTVAGVGFLAHGGRSAAYIVGMSLYVLDAVIFAFVGDYPALGFHLFALWGMWTGFSARRELLRIEATTASPAEAASRPIVPT